MPIPKLDRKFTSFLNKYKLETGDMTLKKLALSDEVLLSVSQPARYIGGEVNMVRKNPRKMDIRFCMCFFLFMV